jgi:alpha-beta hydrolase superfamily lysophospholipase
VLGTAALIAAAVLIDHSNSPAGFASFLIALGLTLRSFARAVDAGFGHYYGWVFGEPKMATRADRVAFRVIHRRRYGQRLTSPSPQCASDRRLYAMARSDEPRVQIVEIDAAELLARFEERPGI